MLARVLLLFLLATNIGVAAWWWLRPPPQALRHSPIEPGVPTLELLGDRGEGEAAAPQTPQLALPTPRQTLRCQRIGPFLTQGDLRRAVGALTPIVQRIQFRETRAVARRGYWVYLPAQGSREAALATARELSARGLQDYYVVTAGDRENTLSLGLFREQSNARQRLADVQALGFNAEMSERNEEVPNYWIDIAAAQQTDWRSVLGSYGGIEATEIACDGS